MNNRQLAREVVAQICDIQSKRMDESFHINAENARAMFEAIVLEALNKATREGDKFRAEIEAVLNNPSATLVHEGLRLYTSLAEANRLLEAASKYVPYNALKGNWVERPIAEVRLITQIEKHLGIKT